MEASGRDLTRKIDRETYLFNSRQTLRHTTAISLLRGGASLIVVQRILGHSSLSTAQRYLDYLERADLAKWAFAPE
jgi:site-specific recombinase XerD